VLNQTRSQYDERLVLNQTRSQYVQKADSSDVVEEMCWLHNQQLFVR